MLRKAPLPGPSRIGETGFEPATARPPAGCATRLRHSPWLSRKRATGIEPALEAWKASVQPQHFARSGRPDHSRAHNRDHARDRPSSRRSRRASTRPASRARRRRPPAPLGPAGTPGWGSRSRAGRPRVPRGSRCGSPRCPRRSAGSTSILRAASRNTSGAGLPRPTSSEETQTLEDPIPSGGLHHPVDDRLVGGRGERERPARGDPVDRLLGAGDQRQALLVGSRARAPRRGRRSRGGSSGTSSVSCT